MWSLRPIMSRQQSFVAIGQQEKCWTLALAMVRFSRHVPECLWCEIREGRDFFDWKQPVDWIIGNPPYSILNAWLEHSFALAANVVYLLPIAKVFGSRKRLLMVKRYGGIVEVYAPWTGRVCGLRIWMGLWSRAFPKRAREQMALVV